MIQGSDLAVVDIGNTSAKVAMCIHNELKVQSIGHQQSDWEAEVARFPTQLHGSAPKHWLIASVNQKRSSTLSSFLQKHHPSASVHWVRHHDVPMDSSVDFPDKLGIDRLLSGFMAAKQYNTPLVIVSFGTAVTIDWIGADSVFAGGMILPGLQLQSESLSLRAEALPELQWEENPKLEVPGKNTLSAIRSGIVLSLAASIDGFVLRYAEQHGLDPQQIRTIITGGDAETIMPHLRVDHEFAPNLVCRALITLHPLNGKSLDNDVNTGQS